MVWRPNDDSEHRFSCSIRRSQGTNIQTIGWIKSANNGSRQKIRRRKDSDIEICRWSRGRVDEVVESIQGISLKSRFVCYLPHYCHVQAEFDEDRRLRLEREEVIVKQLTDHEQEVADKFEKQIVRHELAISL